MKKSLLFKAPVLTASGYGVHARQILKELVESEKYDISIKALTWGNTSILHGQSEYLDSIRALCNKFDAEQQAQQPPKQYDISVQVTIPNEFEKCARLNIGITAIFYPL